MKRSPCMQVSSGPAFIPPVTLLPFFVLHFMLLVAYGAVWTIHHVTSPPIPDSKSIEIGTFSPESYYRYLILQCNITVLLSSPSFGIHMLTVNISNDIDAKTECASISHEV